MRVLCYTLNFGQREPSLETNLTIINESHQNYPKITKRIGKNRGLFKIAGTVRDFTEPSKASENCLKLPRAVQNFLELIDTSKNYVRFSKHFTRNFGREQWTFRAIVIKKAIFFLHSQK